jgi:2-amino-4-hydroxy-6-hydroxymethyldihydropteridine diphosphokinase
MVATFLGLGSNLANRQAYLQKGIHDLEQRGVRIVRTASVYETEPKDAEGQPWFLNTVVEASTTLSPRGLLDVCLSVENQNQRIRTKPNGARTLDIDILFYGDEVVEEDGLSIPHPRFSDRKFVLVPLAEIAPDFIDPLSGKTITTLLKVSRDDSEVRRIAHLDSRQ